MREDDDLNAARGCVNALVWSAIFWAVVIATFVFWKGQ